MSEKPNTPSELLAGAAEVPSPGEDPIAFLERILGQTFPQLFREAHAAFRHDFPELLARHRGKVVAYHGSQRVGLGRSRAQLCEECRLRGLNPDDLLFFPIDGAALANEAELLTPPASSED